MFYTADRATGTFIDVFENLDDARKAIESYEDADMEDGKYTPDFYDIVEVDHTSVDW